ncbi:MAG: hypothetical protein CSA50_00530 [Gammaproteobacteria bacterium]|nr:MAG: hypothetical protein CSA50_00530 [Gammaproteobacteria bacterium]
MEREGSIKKYMMDVIIPLYNCERDIENTVDSILRQNNMDEFVGSIIIVDDCSTDGGAGVVSRLANPKIKLVSLATNGGRSRALNEGVKRADQEYILFLDADCMLGSRYKLKTVYDQISSGAQMIFGYATSDGCGFWDNYQQMLAMKRWASQSIMQQTSACLVCQRALFEQTGGFSEEYTGYGFEDRDLIIRLSKTVDAENIRYLRDLTVIHQNPEQLFQVASKMFEAGSSTAGVFRRRFPKEYRQSSFSLVDFHCIGQWKAALLSIPGLFWQELAIKGEPLLQSQYVPFLVKKLFVKFVSAVSFYQGTRTSARNSQCDC